MQYLQLCAALHLVASWYLKRWSQAIVGPLSTWASRRSSYILIDRNVLMMQILGLPESLSSQLWSICLGLSLHFASSDKKLAAQNSVESRWSRRSRCSTDCCTVLQMFHNAPIDPWNARSKFSSSSVWLFFMPLRSRTSHPKSWKINEKLHGF